MKIGKHYNYNASRLQCRYGHPLRGKNVRITIRKSDGATVRHCRRCAARRTAAWHAANPQYNAIWRAKHPGYGATYRQRRAERAAS